MSVCNIAIESDRIRLVTDTVTYDGKMPVQFNRKVTIRPEAHLAMTARGRRWIGQGFAEHSERWHDMSFALTELDFIVPLVREIGEPMGDGFEVTVAGWYDGRPRVERLLYDAETHEVTRGTLSPGVYLLPFLSDIDILPDLTDEQLGKVAVVQQTLSRKYGLNMCIGGDMELTTITADAITVEKIGEYPDKALTAKRMARSVTAQQAMRAVA